MRFVPGPAKAGHYVLCVIALGLTVAIPLVAQAPQGETERGVLGPVNALGQEVRQPPTPTGPVPRLPDGTVDLGDGIWTGGGPGSMAAGLKKGETLPLLPWAKALREERAKRETDDPHVWCLPMGVPRTTVYPFRFVQNYTHKRPTHMFILHEGNIHSYRQIFMDGRKHPAELDTSWFGHSIGWWEKDTLVIDTVGYNDKFWVDGVGTPHTEQMHTIERWTRINWGTMVNDFTLDDPGAFSRPVQMRFTARAVPLAQNVRLIRAGMLEYRVTVDMNGMVATFPPATRTRSAPTTSSAPQSPPFTSTSGPNAAIILYGSGSSNNNA